MTTTSQLNFLQRLKYAQELWAVVLPAIQSPPNPTLVGWLAQFSDSDIERALTQVPHRIRNWTIQGTPKHDDVYRLVTSFLKQGKMRREPKEVHSLPMVGLRRRLSGVTKNEYR